MTRRHIAFRRHTARPNRRVDTLISIRFIAQRPSQSSDIERQCHLPAIDGPHRAASVCGWA